jgi:carboxypeptidase Taq
MFRNLAVVDIVEKYKPLWALDSVSSLLEWDMETYMPLGSSAQRGVMIAETQLLRQERILQLVDTVSKAEKSAELNDFEKGFLRVLKRDLDYYTKIPPKLLEDILRTTTEGTVVWREARKKSQFSIFKPYLEKIVDLKRQEAEKLGYTGHPYNALMDRFEEDITTDDVDRIFSGLSPQLKEILTKVLSAGEFPSNHPLEDFSYNPVSMKLVNEEALKLLQMPEATFRMDVSTHPFTTSMSVEDVRITTRYEGRNFKASLFSTVHESGHAIYELQIDPLLNYTPLSRATSLGVHESQSRFWENFVGRSREFVSRIYPSLKSNLPFIADYSEDEVYRYVNSVKPSLIRVDADEVTYNFHIMLRYELEKKLIGGEMEVAEVPLVWADLMEKYVGVRPLNDAEGILQDVHWSGGLIGYFATYSLGNIIAGMFYDRIQRDLDLKATVASGDISMIKGWLREKLHKYGSIYSPKELQTRMFGETYNPQMLISYLKEKYLA